MNSMSPHRPLEEVRGEFGTRQLFAPNARRVQYEIAGRSFLLLT